MKQVRGIHSSMRIFISAFLLLTVSLSAHAITRTDLIEKVVAQGVPQRGIEQILDFISLHEGAQYKISAYYCEGDSSDNERACKNHRVAFDRFATLQNHDYALYIDMKAPSTAPRLHLIHMKTGVVESQLVSHGSGSGIGPWPSRFSNFEGSHMTSLGMYIAGGTYHSGNHGLSLRMYGLDASNDQAYLRDIVLHGAYYARAEVLTRIDKKTERPFDRLGHSWGCPATDPDFALRIIPLLKNGALIFIDHEDLLKESMSGKEVSIFIPPIPTPRP